ncbi:tRNA pseudouridine synthase D [Ordospora pajunii]|uniref:tRNA pseudouridine synthase D n=1 Tax=Ordospora pajunii TaxID=3039483 RepID=UPI00295283F3|nr:tRNA pseudouridine synthase D [Ordospora pajunii]KAH9411207.1 tRNA pseudouridine synthase D [Ordospora pajunii]
MADDCEMIGVKKFFGSHVDESRCVLKKTAFDFVVQEITACRICGVSPIVDYEKYVSGKMAAESVGQEECERVKRTEVHRILKYYPFVKAKTVDGRICIEETDVDFYSFVMQKVMFNTIDAGKWICRRLGVSSTLFQFAGNKDKRAVTFQEVTVKCSFMKLYGLAVELNKSPNVVGWEEYIEQGYTKQGIEESNTKMAAEMLMNAKKSVEAKEYMVGSTKICGKGQEDNECDGNAEDGGIATHANEMQKYEDSCMDADCDERLKSSIRIFGIRKSFSKKIGDLNGNRFRVVVRGFTDKHAVKRLGEGFLNYFGQQRFGNKLMNHVIGQYILEKKYDEAVDEIMKCGKCYEMYASGRYEEPMDIGDSTEKYILKSKAKGMKAKDIVFGMRRELRMLYLHSCQSRKFNDAINERIEKGKNVLRGDLVLAGDEVIEVQNPEDFKITDVVLRLEKMDNKLLKGGFRKMVETAYDIDIDVDDAEGNIVIKFSLKSSCYATMALREVIGNSVMNRVKV